jgi:cystathionine beta-lyase
MKPDFDRIDLARLRARRGEKWRLFGPDVLAAWVAEMDFPLAEPVRQAIESALALEDLGYPLDRADRDALAEAFAARMTERFGWSPDPGRVEVLSEVVQGIHLAIHQLTGAKAGVVVQTPVYPPFLAAVKKLERRMLENPLREGGTRSEIDLDGLRRCAADGAELMLLCNPQNPTGRVFTRAELLAIAEIAAAHDWIVVADEIHADLVYEGHVHVPFASLAPEIARRTLTLTSASKAFNVPGLRCAVAHFGSETLQRRFAAFPRGLRGGTGSLGPAVTLAAWRHGDEWLAAALAYLDANRRHVAEFAARRWPAVRHRLPEATFLAWLDCRALGIEPSAYDALLHRGRVALSDGAWFGEPGRGCLRLNFATSRAILDAVLERMDGVLHAAAR